MSNNNIEYPKHYNSHPKRVEEKVAVLSEEIIKIKTKIDSQADRLEKLEKEIFKK